MLEFIVSWQKVDTSDLSELSTTVNGTTLNIQDLEPDTNYSICVSAVSTSDYRVRSEGKCLHIKTLKFICKCYSDLPHIVYLCTTGLNTHICTFMFTMSRVASISHQSTCPYIAKLYMLLSCMCV